MSVTMQPRQTAVEPQRDKDPETRLGRRTLCLSFFTLKAALGVLGLISTIISARAASNLLENSPFLPADAAAHASQSTAPLELRSIVKEDGQYEFSLYDPAKKQSTWVRLNELGNGFLVKSFDPANNTVMVEQHSNTYTLSLKEAKIDVSTALPTPPVLSSSFGNPNGSKDQQVAKNELTPAQIRLLEHLREVKRQREAARSSEDMPGQQLSEDN
jgi:hypothetical protein